MKKTFSKIPLVSPFFKNIQQVNRRYKMNEIVNRSLLVGEKFIPEMHL